MRVWLAAFALLVAGCGGGGGGGAGAPPGSSGSQPASFELILQSEGLPPQPPRVGYFEMDGFDTPKAYVDAVRAAGAQPICYISAGTIEDFRSDYAAFAAIPGSLGKAFPGFPGDFYLNINLYPAFLPLIEARVRMCRDKGFTYVDFDVIDTFQATAADTGFSVPEATGVAYVRELARLAHANGLKAVQKNTPEYTAQFEPYFDAALFEECVRLRFCAAAGPYVRNGKPVFNVEYAENWTAIDAARDEICREAKLHSVMTNITRLDLAAPAASRC